VWNRTHDVRLQQSLIELAWLQRQELVEYKVWLKIWLHTVDGQLWAVAVTEPQLCVQITRIKSEGWCKWTCLPSCLCVCRSRRLCANGIRPQSLPLSFSLIKVTFHRQDQHCSVWSICLYLGSHAESYSSSPPLFQEIQHTVKDKATV